MSQPKVEIYTKAFCGYCHRAKRLLADYEADFTEYDISFGGEDAKVLRERLPDYRTVPQVFIDGNPVGGSDDLAALAASGKLDELLGR